MARPHMHVAARAMRLRIALLRFSATPTGDECRREQAALLAAFDCLIRRQRSARRPRVQLALPMVVEVAA